MNPWIMLGAVMALIGSFFYGQHVGSNAELAKAAKQDAIVAAVAEAAQQAAAGEIAKIKIVHQTNQTRLEREIVHVPDFTQCHAGDAAKRVLDDALTNKAGADPAGSVVVPGTNATR